MTYTRTGGLLYMYFSHITIQGSISTDSNKEKHLPLNGSFITVSDIEDWMIRTAEQIKSERQQIIINK